MNYTTNTLLVISQDAQIYSRLIYDADLQDLDLIALDNVNQFPSSAKEANIIFGDPDQICKILPVMKQLEWVQSTWAGVNLITTEGCRTDYLLTGVKDIFGPIMSEYIICHMLMNERDSLRRYSLQQKRQWDNSPPGLLRNKKVGIMGLGSIGKAIAKTAKFFNMYTAGYLRTLYSYEYIDKVFVPDQLFEFVHDLDYLVCVLPHTPDTTHIINSSVFKAMKKEALLINVGRGNAIDESALVEALNCNEIAGAVLDVFQQEPLPASHPFWSTKGIIITSHTAALSHPEDIAPIFIENYGRFITGKPLNYLIDFNKGY